MRLSVLTQLVGSQARTLKDQRYRFSCTSCGRSLNLQSDYGLILSFVGAAAVTVAAYAAVFGSSGLPWALGFSFAAMFFDGLLVNEIIQRLRNPKLPATAPQVLRE
jgi:hypothetical protein